MDAPLVADLDTNPIPKEMTMSAVATTTAAEQISILLHDDGQTYVDDDGRELDQICRDAGAEVEYSDCDSIHSRTSQTRIRYTLSDGSVILDAGDAWDLGYHDCWCWRGEGHNDECILLAENRFPDPQGAILSLVEDHGRETIEEAICEKTNCVEASVDETGAVWIGDPVGCWMNDRDLAEFLAWREDR